MNKTPFFFDTDNTESGNVFFFLLLAIALIGIVTAALRAGSDENANIDKETMVLKTKMVREYANELERAVVFVMQNEVSEVDIRFAHPDASVDYGDIDTDPEHQIFNRSGGGAMYREAPSGINDGSLWEFYGQTHMPEVGSSRAELLAVLPNVTEEFCDAVNAQYGYTGQPADTATCLNAGASGRFDDGTQFAGAPNTTDEASFSITPAMQGCVICDDSSRHFFHVLMAR